MPAQVNPGFAAQAGHGPVIPVARDGRRLPMRDPLGRLAECPAATSMTGNDSMASGKAIAGAGAVRACRVIACGWEAGGPDVLSPRQGG